MSGVTISEADPLLINAEVDNIEVAADGAGNFTFKLTRLSPEIVSINAGLGRGPTTGNTSLSLSDCYNIATQSNAGDYAAISAIALDPSAWTGDIASPTLTGPIGLYRDENKHLVLAVTSGESSCKYFFMTVEAP